MADKNELLDVIATSLLPLLQAMDTLTWARQRLEPYGINNLVNAINDHAGPLKAALPSFRSAEWPKDLVNFQTLFDQSATATLLAYRGLEEASTVEGFDALRAARRSIQSHLLAERTLYPLASMSTPISQYYLPHERREDEDLLSKLDAAYDKTAENAGFRECLGVGGEIRGGYAVYLPEYLDPTVPAPVVLALHGGRGSGPDFIWSWLPAARASGSVLIAPTAIGETWAITGEDLDSPNISRILDEVENSQTLDRSKILMTGMSDGGTFSYVSGLPDGSLATHIAPFAASFHPLLLEFVSSDRLSAVPIRITHGTRDWMFPIDVAHIAEDAFRSKSARLTFIELEDRAHVFPQDEAACTIDWFLNGET